MRVRSLLREDILRYGARSVTINGLIIMAMRHRGFRAVLFYRFSRRADLAGHGMAARVLQRIGHRMTQCDISRSADIGAGLLLPHPIGVIIGNRTVIGANCTIQQHVTLGGNYGRTVEGRDMPRIGDDVAISCGAVVVGPVEVGNSTIIGANVVITRDVPAASRVAAAAPVQLWGVSSDARRSSSGECDSD